MDLSLNLAQTITDPNVVASLFTAFAVGFLPRLVAAIVVLVVGYFVAGWTGRLVGALMTRSGRLEPTLFPVIGAVVRYTILIFVFVAALAQVGVQTTSMLAALGAAGLAIALALQGTLQNIAAGLMLLWLRPFRAGDSIDTPSVAGTVEEVALFATRLRTADGLYKFVPNSELWNKVRPTTRGIRGGW